MERTVLRHYKYMLVFKYTLCGKPVSYFYRHFISSFRPHLRDDCRIITIII